MDPASGIGIPVAFGAGLVSFLSPCVLPLVPGYISAVAGVAPSDIRARRVIGPRRAVPPHQPRVRLDDLRAGGRPAPLPSGDRRRWGGVDRDGGADVDGRVHAAQRDREPLAPEPAPAEPEPGYVGGGGRSLAG